MANCSNCGVKLNAFNVAYTFDSEEYGLFCSRCNAKFNRFLKDNGFSRSSDLSKVFFSQHKEDLINLEFTNDGIMTISNYIDSLERRAEEEAIEEKRAAELKAAKDKLAAEEKERLKLLSRDRDKRELSFIETTGFTVEGYDIENYLGIISGEVIMGTGFLSELSAGLNDLFGTVSNTMTSKLTEAKKRALEELKQNCLNVGANAVIGVDIDISTIGQNMILACANGTAVIIKKKTE